jgi:hypothetical protein
MARTPKEHTRSARAAERHNRPHSVGMDARSAAASPLSAPAFSDPTLVLRWSEIAGAAVARIAQP